MNSELFQYQVRFHGGVAIWINSWDQIWQIDEHRKLFDEFKSRVDLD